MRKTSLFNPLLLLCISQPLHAAEPDNWTHLLNEPGFMPAIKSCLAVHPQGQGPAVVMNVWHASLEEAGVMTTDLGGGRQVCYASKQTGQVSRSETLFDLPGPLFVSVDQVSVAPKGTCIESTPVYVNLQLQGWILRQPVLDPNLPSACSSPIWDELLNTERAKSAPSTQQTPTRPSATAGS